MLGMDQQHGHSCDDFPIALGLLEAIREMMATSGRSIDMSNYKYSTGLMLMTAYACSIGGVLTPIGTPPTS